MLLLASFATAVCSDVMTEGARGTEDARTHGGCRLGLGACSAPTSDGCTVDIL